MARNDSWLEDLASADGAIRDAASAELRDYLLRTLAKGFGRTLDDATLDDLAQDSVLKVHDKLSTFAGRSKFSTWAASIAVNTALSELRRRRHIQLPIEDAMARGEAALARPPSAELRVQRRSADEKLYRAIDGVLSPRQKQALYAELGGLPLSEIARRMGASKGSLYKLLHDARKKLLVHFRSEGINLSMLTVEAP